MTTRAVAETDPAAEGLLALAPSAPAPAWLVELRRDGAARFRGTGIPDTRVEAWRFTDLKPLRKREFRWSPEPAALSAEAARAMLLAETGGVRLAFVNGVYAPALSGGRLPDEGAVASSLAAALDEREDPVRGLVGSVANLDRHPFAALNTAFVADGAVIRIPPDTTLEAPIHLLFLTAGDGPPRAAYPRVAIELAHGARARVIEEFVGAPEADTFVAPVTEIVVGENASVDHVKLQREGAKTIHLGTVAARLERNARLTGHSLSVGGRLVRTDVDVLLAGEGSECTLNGLYAVAGRQHVDHHTYVDHASPHTVSRQLYKGVLDGKATGVFNGRVLIREGAQRIDASQTNNNLLLSNEALVNTNPELEIFADDVKARHGATIGQIDEEALFYLRSRGIEHAEARRILIQGFAGEMLERVGIEPLRDALAAYLEERF
jgi:Fe-S cluster assembly protein SufD